MALDHNYSAVLSYQPQMLYYHFNVYLLLIYYFIIY